MQYYIPTQDVLGALSDVFSKCNYQFDSSKQSDTYDKLASTFKAKLDSNQFKSNLDKYIEKVKQKIQQHDENDCSFYQKSQINDISKQQDSLTTCYLNSSRLSLGAEAQDHQQQINTVIPLNDFDKQKPSITLNEYTIQTQVDKQEVQTQTDNYLSEKVNVQTQTEIKNEDSKLTKQNQLKLFSQEVLLQIYNPQIKIKSSDFQCQTDQLQEDSQNILINQKVDNNSDQQQQSYHSSDLIDNLQIIHDHINEECIKCQCGKAIHANKIKLVDAECQYEGSINLLQSMNNLDAEIEERFKNIRIRSRCMSQTNQTSEKIQLNDEDQITFLENELQLKSDLLETKNQVILKLHSQIEDLHKLIIDQKDSARNRNRSDSDQSSESYNWQIDQLQNQIQTDADIQGHLTKQMLQYSEETRKLEYQIQELTDQNQDLKEKLDQLTIQITKLKEKLFEIEDNKAKEIDIINEDYQDKLSKQNMIIDDLQSQLNSVSVSPIGLPITQTMKYISQQQFQTVGSDSQQSRGSNCKSKEEKQLLLRNIKKMTTMTAGLMSNKQDYTTLGVLGKIDHYKSQQKLESFNKLN